MSPVLFVESDCLGEIAVPLGNDAEVVLHDADETRLVRSPRKSIASSYSSLAAG